MTEIIKFQFSHLLFSGVDDLISWTVLVYSAKINMGTYRSVELIFTNNFHPVICLCYKNVLKTFHESEVSSPILISY